MKMCRFFGDRIISRNSGPLDLRIYNHNFPVFECFDKKGL
jgi:hypothetical protein